MATKNFIDKAIDNIDIESNRLIKLLLEEFPPGSEEQQQENRTLLKEGIDQFKDSFLRGYNLVLDNASRGKFHLSKEDFELKAIDKKKHPENSITTLSKLLKTKTLQEIFEYSPRMMHEIYELGCEFFHSKEFDQCTDIFSFLITLNPTVYWFWQVLGSAFEEQNKWQEALYAYCVSINCLPLKIEGYRNAVRCALKLKDSDSAIKLLDYGSETAKLEPNTRETNSLITGLQEMKTYIHR